MYIGRRNILIAQEFRLPKRNWRGEKGNSDGKEMKRGYIADKQRALRPELFQFKCQLRLC